jgi:hypothetical protein
VIRPRGLFARLFRFGRELAKAPELIGLHEYIPKYIHVIPMPIRPILICLNSHAEIAYKKSVRHNAMSPKEFGRNPWHAVALHFQFHRCLCL